MQFLRNIANQILKKVMPFESQSSKVPSDSDTLPNMSTASMDPFCCLGVIPTSFRHLVTLLPSSTTQYVLQNPPSSAPLVTSFLSSVLTRSVEAAQSHRTLFFVILQVKALPPHEPLLPTNNSNEPTYQYFVPTEKKGQETILAAKTYVKGRGWREIFKQDAQACLAFLNNGSTVGEGRVWKQLPGVERFWCEQHHRFYEMTCWYQESP
ncbi:hypothetical protein HYFRA_00008804 [Hymenoscyphus fraxineus]|uniref:Uncharacterized protein n=1 Tax=Hymenoscyphus fraxineus TaxID=746836 RepID=A0A9N9L1F5_9HELO|nr:hypothetical protein HYFRA_00008804 [Hymenoscyphus fraxineus]